MSNELIQAADDARRLLRGFAAIETVAAAFDKVGQLEQRKTEVEAALLDLQNKAVLESSNLTSAIEQVKIANAEAKRMTADAKTAADGILSNANAQASDLVKKAEERAQTIVDASSRLVQSAKDAEQAVLANRDMIADEVAALEGRATAAREYLVNLTKG